jgi:amino acid transporter
VHPTFRTPHVALIVQSVLVCALAVFNSFEQLAIIANVSALLLYAVCAIATLMLRQRNVRQPGALPFSVPGGPIIPVITVALIAWMLTSITRGEWSVLVIAIVLTTILYAIARRIWTPMRGADSRDATAA